jgi:3-phenylpropionate/trans-cinnamate dioxygenase ferredoxin subunit
MDDLAGWTRVCAAVELAAGDFRLVDVDGADIAVFYCDGHWRAIEDVCTHDGAPLTGGAVEACEIICPRHGARFCLKTGNALTAPAYEDIAVFPVRVEEGQVYVRDDRWD